jgi:hypothetical protein
MFFGQQVALAVMAVLLKVGRSTVPAQVPSHIPLRLLRLWLAQKQGVPLEAVSLWYNGRRLGDALPVGVHIPPNACVEGMVGMWGGNSGSFHLSSSSSSPPPPPPWLRLFFVSLFLSHAQPSLRSQEQ